MKEGRRQKILSQPDKPRKSSKHSKKRKDNLYEGHTLNNQMETELTKIPRDRRLDISLRRRADSKPLEDPTELNANDA